MLSRASLRYPGEWINLILASIFGTIIFVGLSTLTGGLCCLWGSLTIVIVILWVQTENDHLKTLGLKVNDNNYSRIHSICKRAAQNLGIKLPRIYIDPSEEVNAYTRGVLFPAVILNQGLIDKMTDEEILFTVGHELGHVKLFHFTIKTLLGRTFLTLPWILFIPLYIYRLLFLNGRLSRSMEYSADRAGLHACMNIRDSLSTLVKLKYGKMDPTFFIDASLPRKQIPLLFSGEILLDALRSHPKMIDRMRKLIIYSKHNDIGWDPSVEWLVRRLEVQ
ncbi:MAG: M48 family metallopeptidase [Thermoplasmatota archaeon]